MASVTFSTTVGGDGSTVSDDTSPTTGLRNGGYLTRFVPALQQVVAVAGFVLAQATAAAGSATAASASATAANTSAVSAALSAASAEAAYDAFDDRWLGAKAANPTVDNDGNALLVGAVYWNTTASELRVWTGTIWQTATINGGTIATLNVTGNTTLGDAVGDLVTINGTTTFANANPVLSAGTPNGVAYLNAGKVLTTGAALQFDGTTLATAGKFGITGSGATVTATALQIGTNGAGSRFVYNVPTGGEHDFSVNGVNAFYAAASSVGGLTTGGQTAWSLSNANAGAFTLDSAGNIGFWVTPSAWGGGHKAIELPALGHLAGAGTTLDITTNSYFNGSNWIYKNNGFSTYYAQNAAGQHLWFNSVTGLAGGTIAYKQLMALDVSGNLSLTQTRAYNASADIYFEIGGTDNGYVNAGAVSSWRQSVIGNANGQALRFEGYLRGTGWSEFARITSGGYVQASNTGSYGGVAGVGGISGNSYHIFQSNANSETVLVINGNTGSTVSNVASYLATGAAGFHMQAYVNASVVYKVLANGNVQNTNNSYGAISDAKLKNIIAPRDGAHYWEKFKQIKFWIYSLIADPTNQQLLGVVAQELQEIFPGLILSSPDMQQVTKTRMVATTRQVTEQVEQEQPRTEIVLENGRYVQKTIIETVTVDQPVFDEFPLFDESGDLVMQLVSPEVPEELDEDDSVIVEYQAAVYAPAVHKVPRMETVDVPEEYTENEPTGEVTLSVNYSILGLIADTITQELQRRMEAAEHRLDLLEAA